MIITKSCYKEAYSSGWHRHENIYLTLILKGGSKERRKNQEIECTPGMLLLYPHDELHQNLNYKTSSKNLHIEFEDSWFKKFDIDASSFEGQCLLRNPVIKCGLLNTIAEIHAMDKQSAINLESILLAGISVLPVGSDTLNKPKWIKALYEMLHDETINNWSLSELSNKINVHPVTISKYFPKYFKVNIGDYIRMIKIEKSLPLLSKKSIPMEEVATKNGFIDNAHFTRVFKNHTGITPSNYRTFVTG